MTVTDLPCWNLKCDRNAVGVSAGVPLCNKHYQRWLARGDWSIADKRRHSKCTVENCSRPVRSAFSPFCEGHYGRVRRDSPLGLSPIHPPCEQCGGETSANQTRFCSEKCGREWNYAQLDKRLLRYDTAHKMRAKKHGVHFETVCIRSVCDRDGWRCRICGDSVDTDKRHPDPLSLSIDHNHPLAAGGGHTFDNCRLTHLKCNMHKARKRDMKLAAKVKRQAGLSGQQARRRAGKTAKIQSPGFRGWRRFNGEIVRRG